MTLTKAILKAYNKAKLQGKSFAVLAERDETSPIYFSAPCDEILNYIKDHEIITWVHPNIQPDIDVLDYIMIKIKY